MENPVSRNTLTLGTTAERRRIAIGERFLRHWLRRIRVGSLTVEFPSGARQVFEGADSGPGAVVSIRDSALAWRLAVSGDIGFAEGYMAGDWDTPDVAALLKLCALNGDVLAGVAGRSPLARALNKVRHFGNANTRRGSRRNIAAHYDLGNDFYRLWLDETMTYSSGIFDSPAEGMDIAQRRKYLRLAEMLDLRPGDRVLEIGCGWGGFAEIAAREFGCRVVCLTLSREQAAYAEKRIADASLQDRVEIRIQDYRDVEGRFDRIASIEMFEAVGEKYWPVYLETLSDRLKPGGKAALQIITIADDKFDAYRRSPDFIQRYIFPGGMLPGPQAFSDAVRASGLALKDAFFFGASYAETVRRWDRSFRDNWAEIEKLGFDNRFCRMWRYYLGYCEAGFETGQIDVGQFLLEHAPAP
tara:strand:+ start:11252 stop:12493 length:1242 start_codon:yes stop_codon:yes gene_type:complete